jgi:hypothetical protein
VKRQAAVGGSWAGAEVKRQAAVGGSWAGAEVKRQGAVGGSWAGAEVKRQGAVGASWCYGVQHTRCHVTCVVYVYVPVIAKLVMLSPPSPSCGKRR